MTCECVSGPKIRGFNPVWYFVDTDGNQADDSFYLWVLSNTVPYVPVPVYHDPAGTLPWTNPIQLNANGTLPVDVYFTPGNVYRLELRKNDGTAPPSQADELEYLIEGYIAGEGGEAPIDVTDAATTNQITNPQFADILFDSPYTFTGTNPDPIEIAPGWFLELTGTGTVVIAREPLNAALANPTNAPYALHLTLTGSWTGIPFLRQRFQQNGMLWANRYVSTSLTARSDGTPQSITARLDDSNGAPVAVLLTTGPLTNDFVEYSGVAQLTASTNPNLPPAAYMDYKILLPTTIDLYITSLQVVSSAANGIYKYEQETVDRQIDHEFHYYKSQLEYKPIPSYLTAWNFPQNPAQYGEAPGAQAIGANKSFHAWDQTICFQSVNSGVLVTRAANGGITLTANDPAGVQMALIQYIGQEQAREILSGRSSIALKASCSDIAEVCTIGLYATNSTLPDMKTPNFNSLVATLDANGKVATFNGAGWIELERGIPESNQFNVLLLEDEYRFNNWMDSTSTPRVGNATFMAIVIGTNLIANGQSITFEWVSLNAGLIATRPAPQSKAQVLDDCQQYYWKTFPTATAPVQNAGVDTGYLQWMAVKTTGSNIISFHFPVEMRAVPLLTLFNPVALNNDIRDFTAGGGTDVPNNAVGNLTTKSFSLDATPPGGTGAVGDIFGVHVVGNARFGDV